MTDSMKCRKSSRLNSETVTANQVVYFVNKTITADLSSTYVMQLQRIALRLIATGSCITTRCINNLEISEAVYHDITSLTTGYTDNVDMRR